MAITINQEPYQYLNLSGNPILWTFSSTNTGQTNFSFYIELYINASLDSTHEVFPESGTNGKFDASIYAENNTEKPTLPTTLNGVDSQSSCTVYIKIYEKYSNPATDPPSVQLGSVQTSTTVQVIKGKKEVNDWIQFLTVDDQYIHELTDPSRWLTEQTDVKLREGETYYLAMMSSQNSPSFSTVLTYYDSSDNLLDTVTDASPTTGRLTVFALSYSELESSYGGAGTFADNVSYVEFEAVTATGESTDLFRITIDRTCRLDTSQIHFLSQIGSIDSFTFDRLSRTSLSMESKSFTTIQGGFDGTSFTWDGETVNRGSFQTTSERTLTLTSEWVTEGQKEYLINNLVLSPFILLRTDTGLRRVANTKGLFKFNKKPFDTLFNLEMNIDLGRHSSMII